MGLEAPAWEQRSTARVVPSVLPRKLMKVPFVELADGRLQGVVSSGSDVERVYVASIAAGSYYYCSTNNDRQCGGLRGRPCKHLSALVDAAVEQYGAERVARYLNIDPQDVVDLEDFLKQHGSDVPVVASSVFSRFLHHLAYLELPTITEPLPEMHWFPSGVTVG